MRLSLGFDLDPEVFAAMPADLAFLIGAEFMSAILESRHLEVGEWGEYMLRSDKAVPMLQAELWRLGCFSSILRVPNSSFVQVSIKRLRELPDGD